MCLLFRERMERLTDLDEALEIADRIGYPVLAKAAAGGGGKGMRKVHGAREMEQALSRAQGEAGSAFGDARIFIEKYLETPRHVEFQILADGDGSCVHLFRARVLNSTPSPEID